MAQRSSNIKRSFKTGVETSPLAFSDYRVRGWTGADYSPDGFRVKVKVSLDGIFLMIKLIEKWGTQSARERSYKEIQSCKISANGG